MTKKRILGLPPVMSKTVENDHFETNRP